MYLAERRLHVEAYMRVDKDRETNARFDVGAPKLDPAPNVLQTWRHGARMHVEIGDPGPVVPRAVERMVGIVVADKSCKSKARWRHHPRKHGVHTQCLARSAAFCRKGGA